MFVRHLAPMAHILQVLAAGVLVLAALASFVLTSLSAAGVQPWLSITAAFGGTTLPWAGPAFQIGVTVLLVAVAAFLPSSLRVARLEHSHRLFEIDMDDITKAYRAAHMADRAEMFEMRREFDAVRERYKFLKEKTNLSEIDDQLLIIGAQMSEQSRDLAERFSDRRVARVREGLERRREDVDTMEARLDEIQAKAVKLARMRDDVEIDNDQLEARIDALRAELNVLRRKDPKDDGVVNFRRH